MTLLVIVETRGDLTTHLVFVGLNTGVTLARVTLVDRLDRVVRELLSVHLLCYV